jgi:hypothetical protein
MRPHPSYFRQLAVAPAAFALVIIAFAVIGCLSSCQRTATGLPNTILEVDTVITDTTIFIDVTLDGKRTLGIYNPTQYPPAWGNIWGPVNDDSSLYPYNRIGTAFVKNNINSGPELAFSLGNFDLFTLHAPPPSAAILPVSVADSFFSLKRVNYSRLGKDTSFNWVGDTTYFARTLTRTLMTPGVDITWVDSTGTVWETLYGAADQTGSSFTITGFTVRSSAIPGYSNQATVTASFACRLYDKKGRSMQLTQGRLRQTITL